MSMNKQTLNLVNNNDRQEHYRLRKIGKHFVNQMLVGTVIAGGLLLSQELSVEASQTDSVASNNVQTVVSDANDNGKSVILSNTDSNAGASSDNVNKASVQDSKTDASSDNSTADSGNSTSDNLDSAASSANLASTTTPVKTVSASEDDTYESAAPATQNTTAVPVRDGSANSTTQVGTVADVISDVNNNTGNTAPNVLGSEFAQAAIYLMNKNNMKMALHLLHLRYKKLRLIALFCKMSLTPV